MFFMLKGRGSDHRHRDPGPSQPLFNKSRPTVQLQHKAEATKTGVMIREAKTVRSVYEAIRFDYHTADGSQVAAIPPIVQLHQLDDTKSEANA